MLYIVYIYIYCHESRSTGRVLGVETTCRDRASAKKRAQCPTISDDSMVRGKSTTSLMNQCSGSMCSAGFY